MKSILHRLGQIVTVVAIGYIVVRASHHWAVLREIEWNATVLSVLSLAFAANLLSLLILSVSWGLSLRIMGTNITVLAATAVSALTQIGKYLPGNVGHQIGRVYLATRAGGSPRLAVLATLMEAAAFCAAAALITMALIPHRINLLVQSLPSPEFSLRNILLAIGLLGGGLLFFALTRKWTSKQGPAPASASPDHPRPSLSIHRWFAVRLGLACVSSVSLATISLLLIGGSFALLLRGVFTPTDGTPHEVTLILGWFGLAWLVGFLTPGAPAGFGVREAVLVSALKVSIDERLVLAAAILSRLINVLCDGSLFLVGAAMRRWLVSLEPRESDPASAPNITSSIDKMAA